MKFECIFSTAWCMSRCVIGCIFSAPSEKIRLFLEFIKSVIRMLCLQSIPSRSREGAQIHPVGANNIYQPIYELSPPPNIPIPAQQQKYRRMSIMMLCLVVVYISRLLTSFLPLPLSLPAASASRTPTRLSYSLHRHFRHPIT